MTAEPENHTVSEMAELLRTTEAALYGMRSRGVAPPAIRALLESIEAIPLTAPHGRSRSG